MNQVYRQRIVAVALSILLISCGGSGGDGIESDDESIFPEDVGLRDNNLAIVDFTTSAQYDVNTPNFNMSVTLLNSGSVRSPIPTGWLMESATSDFSSGYLFQEYTLRNPSGETPDFIDPGEQVTLQGFGRTAAVGNVLRFPYRGPAYVRFWVNPNVGAQLLGSGTRVGDSYQLAEVDYSDNLSEVREVVVERRFNECEEDSYEENDELASAFPIELGTSVYTSVCEDESDIFSVMLRANTGYEVSSSDFDFSEPNIAKLSIIKPDGSFLVRESGVAGVFRSEESGVYYMVVRRLFSGPVEGAFSIDAS